MKGYWLHRTEGIFATGKNPYQFDKMCRSILRRGTNSHTRLFFVPYNECTDLFRAKNIPEEFLRDDDILNLLLNNVDFTDETALLSINVLLKKARIDQVQTQTKLNKLKLQLRKRLLFYLWSERFFTSFADHFGKLKNNIVLLHLNLLQVNKFNLILDTCLNNLQLNLDEVYNLFMDLKLEKL